VESERFRHALAAIDAANADDPQEIVVRGARRKKELAHAELVSEWVARLAPDASEALRLAARAHHVRRWEIARETQPPDRAGYHRWRKALQQHHAEIAGRLLRDAGYDAATVLRVQDLVRKRGLGRDPEVQVLEDALCLVFVETQLAEIAQRMQGPKLADVVRKTLRKMSPAARAHAVALPLGERERALLAEVAADAGSAPAPIS
jgi:hypothetical protein